MLLLAALIAALSWWSMSDIAPERGERRPARTDAAAPAAARGDARADDDAPTTDVHRESTPTVDTTPKLRVRLRGLHAQLQWTAPLRIEWNDRGKPYHEDVHDEAVPDADGRCAFAFPDWWTPERQVKARFQGRSDGYRDVYHRIRGTIDPDEEVVLDVQAIERVIGRVSAFALGDDGPDGSLPSETSTNADGVYRLLAPPDVPLLVVATPMTPNTMRWRSLDGIDDSGVMRDDLLPASCELRLTVGEPRSAVDFVLADAMKITGVVRHADGSAAPATVRATPARGRTCEVSHATAIVWRAAQPLSFATSAATDEHGRFSLPAIPGEHVEVFVHYLGELRFCGAPTRQTARPPQRVEITLPPVSRLQATQNGKPAPHARIHIRGEQGYRTNAGGNADVLIWQPTMVRAELGDLRSAWVEVTPRDAGRELQLPLTKERRAVSIQLDGAPELRAVIVQWQSADGRRGDERLERGAADRPFRIWLRPGTYHLRVADVEDDEATFARDGVVVTDAGAEITLGRD